MKLKIASAVFCLFLYTCSLQAQLLWKISGNGLEKPSYVFGSHHLIDKNQIRNFDKILAICGQQDAVVGEMDMTNMAVVDSVLMKASMLTGKTCKDLFSAEDYTFLDMEFKNLVGVGMDKLGVMKPMTLNTLYILFSYLKSQGISKQPEAVDILFQKEAEENEKKVIGLETAEYQAHVLFDSSPLAVQIKELLEHVKDKEKYTEQIQALNSAYLQGDFKRVEALEEGDDSMTPEEKQNFIVNRNNNWLKQLPELMKNQSCFICVGFMHLVGEEGLIHQLRTAGYNIEAVTL